MSMIDAGAARAPSSQTVFNIAEFPFFAVPGQASNVAKFNAASAAAALVHGKVYFGNGHWNPSGGSLQFRSQVDVEGESLAGAVWDGQIYPSALPIAVNFDPNGWSFSAYDNFSLRGGTWGVLVNSTTTPQNLTFRNVQIDSGTAGSIRSNTAWESCQAYNLILYQTPIGLQFDAGAANMLVFDACHFLNLTTIFDWSGATAEGVELIACHGEGGAVGGASTFKLNACKSFTLRGGYYEGTSSIFVTETNSVHGVSLDGVHRTGPYTWAMTTPTGGAARPNFIGQNSSSFAEDGPSRYFVAGTMAPAGLFGNNNAVYTQVTKQHKQFQSAHVAYPAGTAQQDLIVISRAGNDGAATNMQTLIGELLVTYYHIDGGGFDVSYSRIYHLKAFASGSAAIVSSVALVSAQDIVRGSTLTVREKAGTTLNTLTWEAVFTGIPAGLQSSVFQWSYRDLSASANADKYLTADLP